MVQLQVLWTANPQFPKDRAKKNRNHKPRNTARLAFVKLLWHRCLCQPQSQPPQSRPGPRDTTQQPPGNASSTDSSTDSTAGPTISTVKVAILGRSPFHFRWGVPCTTQKINVACWNSLMWGRLQRLDVDIEGKMTGKIAGNRYFSFFLRAEDSEVFFWGISIVSNSLTTNLRLWLSQRSHDANEGDFFLGTNMFPPKGAWEDSSFALVGYGLVPSRVIFPCPWLTIPLPFPMAGLLPKGERAAYHCQRQRVATSNPGNAAMNILGREFWDDSLQRHPSYGCFQI